MDNPQTQMPWPSLASLVPQEGQVQVEGIVSERLFLSEETGFAVVRLETQTSPRKVVAVGSLSGLRIGETARIIGKWEDHTRFGQQLLAEKVLPLLPETRLGIERYLSTLSGFGKELARRIVAELGLDALTLLEEQTFRVAQIKGVGKKRAARALLDARSRKEEREVMVFLQGLGISASFAARIHKKWGQSAIVRVRENPYALAREVSGIGFHIADQIAMAMGVEKNSLLRCAAGVRHVLLLASDAGHCFLPEEELRRKAATLLCGPPPEPTSPEPRKRIAISAPPTEKPDEAMLAAIDHAMESLRSHGETVHEGPDVYLSTLHKLEGELCQQVKRLLTSIRKRVPQVREQDIHKSLAEGQKKALAQCESSPLSIITGGPGTGKTTIVSGLVHAALRAGMRVVLAAPTGRAAKRLSEATSYEAKTIHRLLRLIPGEREQVGKELDADLLVCDEASMLDLPLTVTLLQSVPSGTTVVLVGDVDQLPSVGPGRVLADLIDSQRIPVTRLHEVFRQAEGSGIIQNAQAILSGELPRPQPVPGAPPDFYWIEVDDAQIAKERVVTLVHERIPQRFGFSPLSDIQVLTPMHRGETGTVELNRALQAVLNPAASPTTPPTEQAMEKPAGTTRTRFFIGDKVMQNRNNYELDVWNGDIGLVVGQDEEEDLLLIRFDDDRQVAYDAAARDDLELAYAISVHKSQGSEYPAVVIPLHLQHFPLLRRNLLYTAVTRGKKLVVLVGSRRAVNRAAKQTGDLLRYTGLRDRLRSILPVE